MLDRLFRIVKEAGKKNSNLGKGLAYKRLKIRTRWRQLGNKGHNEGKETVAEGAGIGKEAFTNMS